MTHLKTLVAPKPWNTPRKSKKYITRPNPGPHSLETSIPLNIIIRDVMHLTATTRETKRVMYSGKVLVDNKARKDHHFPVGFMDILTLPDIKQSYQILFNNQGHFIVKEISQEEAGTKLCKIINKTLLNKGITQITLHDGKNIIVEKGQYKVGDTVAISLKDAKISKHLKFEKGSLAFLTKGQHVGKIGVLEEIKRFKSIEEDRIILKTKDESIETLKSYAFIIEKPI